MSSLGGLNLHRLQIQATTYISVLCVSRRGWMELMSLWLDRKVHLSVDVCWRAQPSVWHFGDSAASDDFFSQVSKIIGAASEADWPFDIVLKLGPAVTEAIASIACALGHCHIPGRSEYSVIHPKAVEIGLSLHNELVSNYSNRIGWSPTQFLGSAGR